MRNYTDSCGQQWVDNGMGWVPAEAALGKVGRKSYNDSFQRGKEVGPGACNPEANWEGANRNCPECCWMVSGVESAYDYDETGIFDGCMSTCSAQADQQGRRQRPQRPQPPRFRGRGAATAAVESSSATSAALMGNDGRWYAPDGLGGTLVWNGTGWYRQ